MATVVATTGVLGTPVAGADCELAINGRPVPLIGSPRQPLVIAPNEVIRLEGTLPSARASYRVWLSYFGMPITLREGRAEGTQWREDVQLGDYRWLAAASNRIEWATFGAAPCAGVIYIRVGAAGSIATVVGAVGVGLSLIGLAVFVRTLLLASRPMAPKPARPDSRVVRARPPSPTTRRLQRLAAFRARSLVHAGAAITAANKPLLTEPIASNAVLPERAAYEIVFDQPLAPEERSQLDAEKVQLHGHLPPATYRSLLTATQVQTLQSLPFVNELRRYGLDQTLAGPTLDSVSGPNDATVLIDCMVHKHADLRVVREVLAGKKDIDVVSDGFDAIRIAVSPTSPSLVAVADLPEVRRLAIFEPPTLACDRGRALIGLAYVPAPAVGAPGGQWDGSGETVAIFDSVVDNEHVDLKRVKVQILPGAAAADPSGHGTHVAGIVGGAGTASGGALSGMAPGADLLNYALMSPDGRLKLPVDLGELLGPAYDANARIINLSWGQPINGDYDTLARSLDHFLRAHPDVLVVIAAGNSGSAPTGYHRLKTIGTPASAKNALTVGASETDRQTFGKTLWGAVKSREFPMPPAAKESVAGAPDLPAASSSRGPTEFDSIKPDLIAPGTYILSTRASWLVTPGPASKYPQADCPEYGGQYVYDSGTSMSAPVVAGAAAVVRQYLRATHGAPPSAALLKAVLISATRRGQPQNVNADEAYGYPDFHQGFGRLDLSELFGTGAKRPVLATVDVANESAFALEARAAEDSGRAGSASFRFSTTAEGPLRVTLAWTDVPGVYVQNNLQLQITGAGGLRQTGNSEHTYLKEPAVDDPEGRGFIFDKRNNVEQVRIPVAKAGVYRLLVSAQNTPSPPQGYALCVVGALDGKELERIL
jgi:serine protease AprX